MFLIKSAEGDSFAKKRVKPDEIGVKIKGVKVTGNREVLIVAGRTPEGDKILALTIVVAVGKSGVVHNLVPNTEVKILDFDLTTVTEEVEEALSRFFGGDSLLNKRMFMT